MQSDLIYKQEMAYVSPVEIKNIETSSVNYYVHNTETSAQNTEILFKMSCFAEIS